jgi:hypothetical protein
MKSVNMNPRLEGNWDETHGSCARISSLALPFVFFASLWLGACTTTSPEARGKGTEPPVATRQANGIENADSAYYFDDSNKLVAVEALKPPVRTIKKSADHANEDGANLIFKSTCQSDYPAYDGEVEMIGKAVLAVYAISTPATLDVLAVEDLAGVASRKIVPLPRLGGGGACCCALKRCGPVKCCPCGSTC